MSGRPKWASRGLVALVLAGLLALGAASCGRYGPPVRKPGDPRADEARTQHETGQDEKQPEPDAAQTQREQ
jgi:predicted small lipoprotein YifL